MALKQEEQAIINLVINNKESKASLKEVSGVVNALRADLNKMHEADNPTLYRERIRELRRMEAAQGSLREQINGGSNALRRFRQDMMATAAGVFGGNIFTAIGEKITSFIPNMINRASDLADVFSDIQKTTGMTANEVEGLNKGISKIDTRTKAKELRDIAINAGQLGVAKGDVLGFVDSIDKVNVALGDEFGGGAAEVSDTIGKIRNVFTDIRSDKIDQDILHIGNAMNALGADGLATAPVISDFAGRIGGAGIQMGLTSGQVLGLSATLQELNVNTERGSTAVVAIIQKMLTNTSDFAAVAGMQVKDFKELLDSDLYGAFVKVVKGAGASRESASQFATILDKLKVDGVGATEVISKLSANTGMLDSKVQLASDSLKDTSSIMSEFNLKNNNLAANVEKLSKKFAKMWDSSAIKGFLSDVIGAMASTQTESEKLAMALEEQKQEFRSLNTSLSPLLQRHDELKSKSKLSKDEQVELKKTIQAIADYVPTAVTGYDKLGNAIGINTEKAREFVKMQRALLLFQNRDAIETTREEIKFKEQLRDTEASRLKQMVQLGYFSNEQLKNIQNVVKKYTNELDVLYARLKALKGGMLEDFSKPPPKSADTSTESDTNDSEGIIIDEKNADEELKYLQGMLDRMDDSYQASLAKRLEENESEEAAIRNKYSSHLREAEQSIKNEARLSQARKAIKRAEEAELETLRQKQEREEAELIENLMKEAEEEHEAFMKDKIEAQEQLYQAGMDDRQREQLAVDQHYETLLRLADQYGLDSTGLYEKWSAAKTKVEEKYNEESKKKAEDLEREKNEMILQATEQLASAVFSIMSNSNRAETDARIAELERQKEAELSNKNLTDAQRERIEKKYEAKIKDERKRAWQAEQRASIAQAIINGALAMTKVSAQTGVLTFAFSPMIAAMTAAQIAVIASQKAPQYAKGVRKAKKGLAIVGEEGQELIEENGHFRLTGNGAEPTFLQEGANVYTASETADILAGRSTPVVFDAYSQMNATSRKSVFNQEAFSTGLDRYRYGASSITNQPAAPAPDPAPAPTIINQFDTSALEDKMDRFIEAAENAWNMSVFIEKKGRYDDIRDKSSA